MATNLKIWIALGITIVAVFAAIWQIANVRGVKARGRRRAAAPQDKSSGAGQRRGGDTRALSGPEKRLYSESQKLLKQGKIASAARILEQLSMQREAIQALEDHGLIHDAAKILMRMQRANRAGVIYARHGMWENAAQCFKMANMPLEVAKCARESGNLAMAAEYFEKVGRFEDAGECYEQLGDLHRAARIFSQVGQRGRAMQAYNQLAAATDNLQTIEFEENELQQIVDYLGDGHTDPGLADVVVSRNKLTDVLLNLVSKGMTKQACELYLRATSDIGPMLMAEVNYQNRSASCLAEVFINVSNFLYAGMIYERMNAFKEAGEAFEAAEDFERAAYCYERAGVDGKVKVLKEKAKNSPGPRPGGRGHSAFALSDVMTTADKAGGFNPDDNESTAVIDTKRGGNNLPPPPRIAPPAPAPRKQPWDDQPALKPAQPAFSLSSDDDDAPTDDAPQQETPAVMPPLKTIPVDDDDNAPEAALPPASGIPAEPPVRLDDGRAAFHKAQFFGDLDFEQKNKLWNIGITREFKADETILTYNDEPKGVYVIIQGSVSCYKQVGGKEAYVDQMGEAESFGELWLLADQPTAVRFVATKESKIRVIGREAFNDLLDKDGTIARKVYRRFTMRLLKRLLRPQNQRPNQAAS